MKIELIETGFFHADGGAMFGATPKTAWQRRYPSDEANGCVLAMRSMLITDDDGRITLIDTGAGSKHLKSFAYYRFFNLTNLSEVLATRNILPEQVTDVVLTHLHFDHCGCVTHCDDTGGGTLSVTFPNARHWVGRAQWENFLSPHALEKDSYFPEDMMPVEDAGLLRLLAEDTMLSPSVSLRLYDGHTPGQIVPVVHTSERTFVFAGDVIPLAACISPAWISAYDTFPLTSYNEKLRLLEEAATENQTVIFCHDACIPCGEVRKAGKHFLINKAP
ncbi:MAG: MBL fold metallo-hydrolase [Tannerellaceae bacterium]|jgi:glyoxylase-like metal-dependent hydrolase (beta-lactamase superfamily II)|nr:MBL fold metallo-hydrolase [Tannerellaceae bacterium]